MKSFSPRVFSRCYATVASVTAVVLVVCVGFVSGVALPLPEVLNLSSAVENFNTSNIPINFPVGGAGELEIMKTLNFSNPALGTVYLAKLLSMATGLEGISTEAEGSFGVGAGKFGQMSNGQLEELLAALVEQIDAAGEDSPLSLLRNASTLSNMDFLNNLALFNKTLNMSLVADMEDGSSPSFNVSTDLIKGLAASTTANLRGNLGNRLENQRSSGFSFEELRDTLGGLGEGIENLNAPDLTNIREGLAGIDGAGLIDNLNAPDLTNIREGLAGIDGAGLIDNLNAPDLTNIREGLAGIDGPGLIDNLNAPDLTNIREGLAGIDGAGLIDNLNAPDLTNIREGLAGIGNDGAGLSNLDAATLMNGGGALGNLIGGGSGEGLGSMMSGNLDNPADGILATLSSNELTEAKLGLLGAKMQALATGMDLATVKKINLANMKLKKPSVLGGGLTTLLAAAGQEKQ